MKLKKLVFELNSGQILEVEPEQARELYNELKKLFDPTYITWTSPYPISEPWSTPASPNVKYYSTGTIRTDGTSKT